MSEKNLPIKLVLQKETDTLANPPGGSTKFFSDVTPELKNEIASQFEGVLSYYDDVFSENTLLPAVGKVTVIPDAIAKSHRPNDLCKDCPIIGNAELGTFYIKVKKDTIQETIRRIHTQTSQKFQANLTTISEITPITEAEKITPALKEIHLQGDFDRVKTRIKIKLFDFDDDFDNSIIWNYVMNKLSEYGFSESHEVIAYNDEIKFIKVSVNSFADIDRISSINGVKTVDFFQEYSMPIASYSESILQDIQDERYEESTIQIGIIDGGISENNQFLAPYIAHREVYVSPPYQNLRHGTFVASCIQYGNQLNSIPARDNRKFKFVDIVAIPNSDPKAGPTDSISEDELMEILVEVMEKYSPTTKIWNLSLGIPNMICSGSMSDLGVFLDYLQDKYHVQFFVSSGNLTKPLRQWPPQPELGDIDRIISPADSIRAITVGSIALNDSAESIVKADEPSPFSRRGPGANYVVKPEVVDYGGNICANYHYDGIGIKGLDINGNIVEGVGTSYSTPRVLQKFASVYDEMQTSDLLLTKALLIHSARMSSRHFFDNSTENLKYYGFGMPDVDAQSILLCSKDEVTLVFKQKILPGTHLELFNFPYPSSLIRHGKCYGEIGMTLVYNPLLDEKYGMEYCRANVDASFGIYKTGRNGNLEYKGCVPLECTWDEKYERFRVENGFKWSPVKSYYRKIRNGIDAGDGWKIRINMNPRNETLIAEQEFVLIITIKDPNGNDIYSEVINGLRERGYVTNNLEIKQKVRIQNTK